MVNVDILAITALRLVKISTSSTMILVFANQIKDGISAPILKVILLIHFLILTFLNNNNNNGYPSLKDLVYSQGTLTENLNKKLLANDKILENINAKLDDFSSAMKNQE